MRPQPVAIQSDAVGSGNPQCHTGAMGNTAECRVQLTIEEQRRQRRSRGDNRMTEMLSELVPETIAAGLW